MLAYQKVIISGNMVEIFRVTTAYHLDGLPSRNREAYLNEDITEDISRSEEHKKRALYKAKTKIKRLIQTNFGNQSKFITLTFNNEQDYTNLSWCYKQFHKFIIQLRERDPKLQYVCVVEFQDRNGRGAVHFHLVCNLRFISHFDLMGLWGHGFIWIKKVADEKNIGRYLIKYMTKAGFDPRFSNHRRWFCSRSLSQPIVYYGDNAWKLCEYLKNEGIEPGYCRQYYSEFNGNVRYELYIIPDIQDVIRDWG